MSSLVKQIPLDTAAVQGQFVIDLLEMAPRDAGSFRRQGEATRLLRFEYDSIRTQELTSGPRVRLEKPDGLREIIDMGISLVTRVASAWSRHGPMGFLRLIGKNLAYFTGELVSGRLFAQERYAVSEFDQAYGIDTERIREIGSLDIARSQNARHAVRYQPSPQRAATEAIHSLEIDHAQFSFLDFGAGKGRVLVIAAELPFKAVIGIELSRELCEVATKNIAKIDALKRAAARIECANADVTSYPFPDTPLVCYFYNPFDRVIMGKVVDRLVDSLQKTPREMLIIYLHPVHRALFEDSGYWSLVSEKESFLVLRSHLPMLAHK